MSNFLIFEKRTLIEKYPDIHNKRKSPKLYSKSDLKNTKNSFIKLNSVSVYASGIVINVEMYKPV